MKLLVTSNSNDASQAHVFILSFRQLYIPSLSVNSCLCISPGYLLRSSNPTVLIVADTNWWLDWFACTCRCKLSCKHSLINIGFLRNVIHNISLYGENQPYYPQNIAGVRRHKMDIPRYIAHTSNRPLRLGKTKISYLAYGYTPRGYRCAHCPLMLIGIRRNRSADGLFRSPCRAGARYPRTHSKDSYAWWSTSSNW